MRGLTVKRLILVAVLALVGGSVFAEKPHTPAIKLCDTQTAFLTEVLESRLRGVPLEEFLLLVNWHPGGEKESMSRFASKQERIAVVVYQAKDPEKTIARFRAGCLSVIGPNPNAKITREMLDYLDN